MSSYFIYALFSVHNSVILLLWQGPRLVTLGGYRDQAEELLVAIADLTYPRTSDGWLDKMSRNVSYTD